jgi:hypothetical protein
VALLICSPAWGDQLEGIAKPDASAWPEKPVAMLVEQNPWAMVMGGDLPSVEVYSDGTVLRADPNSRKEPAYLVSQIRGNEWDRLLQSIGPTPAFDGLKETYSVSGVTDRQTTAIVLSDKGRPKRVSVYGYSISYRDARAFSGNRLVGSSAPVEFDRLAKLLAALAPKNEAHWQPRFVEVMLWPFEYSRESPKPWPAAWPTSSSPMAFRRGESWSVILPASELPQLRDFVRQTNQRQTILWNGHKWSIAYRLVLPASTVAVHIAAASLAR